MGFHRQLTEHQVKKSDFFELKVLGSFITSSLKETRFTAQFASLRGLLRLPISYPVLKSPVWSDHTVTLTKLGAGARIESNVQYPY